MAVARRLSEVSWVRVLLPVKPLMTVLLNGPHMIRSTSPPWLNVFWISDLTSASVRARTVPSVAVPLVVPATPPVPRAPLVEYQPHSERSWRAVVEPPETAAWLPVSTVSTSRFSSLVRLTSWYTISRSRPALLTASWVPETIASLRLIWQRLFRRVVADTDDHV